MNEGNIGIVVNFCAAVAGRADHAAAEAPKKTFGDVVE